MQENLKLLENKKAMHLPSASSKLVRGEPNLSASIPAEATLEDPAKKKRY